MKHFFSEIISNDLIAKDFYRVCFKWDRKAQAPEPGKFLTIRVADTSVPLLRRPFAVSGYEKEDRIASVIYQKRGVATEILTGKNKGDKLDIIGPIGNTFGIDKTANTFIIVAGGIGLGPMIYISNCLKDFGKGIKFIFGAKNKSFIPKRKIFGFLNPIICTDDGTEGFKGTTVDYLATLKNGDVKSTTIYACGPKPMLKGCHEFALQNILHCEILMEQTMACGVGACMGCVIRVRNDQGYKRVCAEGAVFNSRDIIWT